jgi:hypothetical protein
MVDSSFRLRVEAVLNLLKDHSRKHKRSKSATTKLERLAGWTSIAAGVIMVAGETLRQVGNLNSPPWHWVPLSVIVAGFVIFLASALAILIEFVRTIRHPFIEHISRINEALDHELELIGTLARFDNEILEFVQRRLQLQSTRVTSRMEAIGDGDGLRMSLVGVVLLVVGLISQYEPAIHGLTMKSLAFFGAALLLGLSIGGLLMRYGVSQAEYYCGIIELTLLREAHRAKTRREPFSRRLGG